MRSAAFVAVPVAVVIEPVAHLDRGGRDLRVAVGAVAPDVHHGADHLATRVVTASVPVAVSVGVHVANGAQLPITQRRAGVAGVGEGGRGAGGEEQEDEHGEGYAVTARGIHAGA